MKKATKRSVFECFETGCFEPLKFGRKIRIPVCVSLDGKELAVRKIDGFSSQEWVDLGSLPED